MLGTTEGSNEVNSITLLQTSALTFLVFRLSKSVISRLIKNNVFLFTCQTSTDFFYLSAHRPDYCINFFLFIFNQSSFSIVRIIVVCVYQGDRKSTRLNSSHVRISYAVFCLKKKKTKATNVEYV